MGLEWFDFFDLAKQETKTPDLSVFIVLDIDKPWCRKTFAIFPLGPDAHHRKCNALPSPWQLCGVHQAPALEIAGRTIRLTSHVIEQPNLRSRDRIDPLTDIVFAAKHNRSELIFVVRRYLGEHVR